MLVVLTERPFTKQKQEIMTSQLNISITKNKNKSNEKRVEKKGKGIDKGGGFGAKN